MSTQTFNTNIKCSACVAKVTPYLDEAVGAGNWQVDLSQPTRPLTVTNNTDAHTVQESLQKAGYRAEKAS
ncbi:heavy-metal-associated domain-containing protein [Parachryseolinea silvisoli]|uniref:heavy-metal-associated domain-containing protein n=1 Tax=Parachryseolinea silvisoli TaxID=2873601 RepID=UPI002265CD67|nr:heavy metal transport/detoxification protein [Parachryseolinea silvisoli]MCD9019074.1 heavy metal transport/detoxification protein [Parachryseolinea silvisoli]